MRESLVQAYLHCVWGTWDRLPLIDQSNEKPIYQAILDKCKEMGIDVIALGGMPDHVHLFVRFPATISVADFIKGVRGSSSHLVTHQVNPGDFFKWQGSYAAFSVSESDIPRIKAYIEHQKEHHTNNEIDETLE